MQNFFFVKKNSFFFELYKKKFLNLTSTKITKCNDFGSNEQIFENQIFSSNFGGVFFTRKL